MSKKSQGLPTIGEQYPVIATAAVEPVVTATPPAVKVVGIHTAILEFAIQDVSGYSQERVQGMLPQAEAAVLQGYFNQLHDKDVRLKDGRRVSTQFHAIRFWLQQLQAAVAS